MDSNTQQPRCSGDIIGFLSLVNCKLMLPFEELFRGELTNLQLLTLCALQQSGEISVTELAERLYLSKQHITKIIARLCEENYIERRRHPSDGRIVLIRLSDKTRDLFDERREHFSAAASQVIERYDSVQDVDRFNELISEMCRILSVLPAHAIEQAGSTDQ